MTGETLDIDRAFRDHGAFIGRCIERMVGPGEHVDDILQEVFIVAFKKRETFDSTRAKPTTWLYGIAQNLCRRHLRSQRRFGVFKTNLEAREPDSPEQSHAPDVGIERAQAVQQVWRAMQKLPLKQREVFALYELEGKEGTEIAEIAGIPEGTVWTRLHHARKTFKKALQRQSEAEVTP